MLAGNWWLEFLDYAQGYGRPELIVATWTIVVLPSLLWFISKYGPRLWSLRVLLVAVVWCPVFPWVYRDWIFTQGGPACFVVLFLAVGVPWIYFGCLRGKPNVPERLLAICTVAVIFAYADVVTIAVQAQRICVRDRGATVFEPVTVPGFAGVLDAEYWLAHGFTFIEGKRSPRGPILRFSKSGPKFRDIRQEEVDVFASEYEVARQTIASPPCCTIFQTLVQKIATKEIAGQRNSVVIRPSYLDRLFLDLFPIEHRPITCGRVYDILPRTHADTSTLHFLHAVLHPKSSAVNE